MIKYQLLKWRGDMQHITIGKEYEFFGNAYSGFRFKDDADWKRCTSHGDWARVVQGVQKKHTFLDDIKPDPERVTAEEVRNAISGNTGANGNYYSCVIRPENTLDNRPAYKAEANDIIEVLNMNFAEANAFKAIWRKAAARNGNGKANHDPLYDAQKVLWAGERLVAQETK